MLLLALLSGCHLFVSGAIDKTCDDIPGCDDTGGATIDSADTDSTDTAPPEDTDCDDPATWYADADSDGFGDPDDALEACAEPDGYTADATDCDDGAADAYPGADEVWYDGVDQDCAGGQDYDQDGDGYLADEPGAPDGGAYDCDDADPDVRPEQAEVCGDGVDTNCDGSSNDCALSGGLSLGDVERVYTGEAGYEAGGAGGWIGDMNFSGTSDIAVSAPNATDAAGGSIGRVWIVTDETAPGALDEEAYVVIGGREYEALGQSVAPAGDVDGDGAPDFLLGAPYADEGASIGGGVYLFRGPVTSDLTLDDAAGNVIGTSDGGYGGYMMLTQAGAGPSGEDILAFSEFGWEDGRGRVLLIPTGNTQGVATADDAAEAVLTGPADNTVASGFALAGGDFNGDGLQDLAVSGPGIFGGTNSTLYLNFGPVNAGQTALVDADVLIVDETSSDSLGSALAAGDVDGDGLDDLAAGAAYYDDKFRDMGAVFLYRGGVTGGTFSRDEAAEALVTGDDEAMYTGQDLALGDTDGDGRADLLVGAVGAESGGRPSGAAYLLLGPISGAVSTLDSSARAIGQNRSDQAGALVDLGYANDDPYADLLIGVPGFDREDSGSDAGAVYLLLGQGL